MLDESSLIKTHTHVSSLNFNNQIRVIDVPWWVVCGGGGFNSVCLEPVFTGTECSFLRQNRNNIYLICMNVVWISRFIPIHQMWWKPWSSKIMYFDLNLIKLTQNIREKLNLFILQLRWHLSPSLVFTGLTHCSVVLIISSPPPSVHTSIHRPFFMLSTYIFMYVALEAILTLPHCETTLETNVCNDSSSGYFLLSHGHQHCFQKTGLACGSLMEHRFPLFADVLINAVVSSRLEESEMCLKHSFGTFKDIQLISKFNITRHQESINASA